MATWFIVTHQVKRLMTKEGQVLVRCERAKLHFKGWLSETPGPLEEEQRELIDALEGQVDAFSAVSREKKECDGVQKRPGSRRSRGSRRRRATRRLDERK